MKEPVVVSIEPLSETVFSPYGKVLSLPSIPPTGKGKNYKYWSGLVELPKGNVSIGMVQVQSNIEPIDMMEAHTEPEMLICGEKPHIILAAGPSKMDNINSQPKVEEVRAFLMRPGQGVLFFRGTWHHVPMPLEGKGLCTFIGNPAMKGHGNTDEHWVKFAEGKTLILKR